FISSVYGRESGGRTGYNMAKAAEISLAKALSREVAADNILVNSVAPGSLLFPGSSWERRQQADPEAIAAFVKADLPLGRFGRPIGGRGPIHDRHRFGAKGRDLDDAHRRHAHVVRDLVVGRIQRQVRQPAIAADPAHVLVARQVLVKAVRHLFLELESEALGP